MAILKLSTHQGEVVGVGPFKGTKPQILKFRQTRAYWISTSGSKFSKRDGMLVQKGVTLATGTLQLRLQTLKKLKEGTT